MQRKRKLKGGDSLYTDDNDIVKFSIELNGVYYVLDKKEFQIKSGGKSIDNDKKLSNIKKEIKDAFNLLFGNKTTNKRWMPIMSWVNRIGLVNKSKQIAKLKQIINVWIDDNNAYNQYFLFDAFYNDPINLEDAYNSEGFVFNIHTLCKYILSTQTPNHLLLGTRYSDDDIITILNDQKLFEEANKNGTFIILEFSGKSKYNKSIIYAKLYSNNKIQFYNDIPTETAILLKNNDIVRTKVLLAKYQIYDTIIVTDDTLHTFNIKPSQIQNIIPRSHRVAMHTKMYNQIQKGKNFLKTEKELRLVNNFSSSRSRSSHQSDQSNHSITALTLPKQNNRANSNSSKQITPQYLQSTQSMNSNNDKLLDLYWKPNSYNGHSETDDDSFRSIRSSTSSMTSIPSNRISRTRSMLDRELEQLIKDAEKRRYTSNTMNGNGTFMRKTKPKPIKIIPNNPNKIQSKHKIIKKHNPTPKTNRPKSKTTLQKTKTNNK